MVANRAIWKANCEIGAARGKTSLAKYAQPLLGGTNLVGAAKVLKDAWQQVSAEVGKSLAKNRIDWHHNPPRASYFGGLFEAAVGSFKRFVRRMPVVVNLSYEDFYTAVCTWEAILNRRPLHPLSDNSHDL